MLWLYLKNTYKTFRTLLCHVLWVSGHLKHPRSILCLIKVEMYLDLRIAVQLNIVVKSITDAENLLTFFLTIWYACTVLTNQMLQTYLCQPSCIIVLGAIFVTIACFAERFISFIWLHWLASFSCVLRRRSCVNIFFSRTNRLILTKFGM